MPECPMNECWLQAKKEEGEKESKEEGRGGEGVKRKGKREEKEEERKGEEEDLCRVRQHIHRCPGLELRYL